VARAIRGGWAGEGGRGGEGLLPPDRRGLTWRGVGRGGVGYGEAGGVACGAGGGLRGYTQNKIQRVSTKGLPPK